MGSKDVTSRAAVLKAIAECDALGRDRFLKRYHFRRAFTYTLKYDGKEYDSKAILGVAHGYQFPEYGPLKQGKFSGGKTDAAKRIHQLGFDVTGINRRKDEWSLAEVELLVSDYFSMLLSELVDEPINKTKHRRSLKSAGVSRSDGSIEKKHQNVSSVLDDFGLPFIDGYKPLSNRQALLESVVIDYLSENPEIVDPSKKTLFEPSDFGDQVFVDSPSLDHTRAISRKRQAVRIDYAAREAAQRQLGEAGEKWVYELERRRLRKLGHSKLANEVIWVSKELGDGLGYDIRSFEDDGSEMFIEVKTTKRRINEPFLLTPNELAKSKEATSQYAIYRVFGFGSEPGIYVLRGPIDEMCDLEVTGWRAFPNK